MGAASLWDLSLAAGAQSEAFSEGEDGHSVLQQPTGKSQVPALTWMSEARTGFGEVLWSCLKRGSSGRVWTMRVS